MSFIFKIGISALANLRDIQQEREGAIKYQVLMIQYLFQAKINKYGLLNIIHYQVLRIKYQLLNIIYQLLNIISIINNQVSKTNYPLTSIKY